MKKAITLLVFFVCVTGSLWAQPLPPPPPNVAIPLDVIVGTLIFGGILYGIVRLVKSRTVKQETA